MLPDSSSDLRQPGGDRRHKGGHFSHRIKTELEVKQEPSWDGEVSLTPVLCHNNTKFSDEDGGVERPLVLVQPRGA